jgi:hypothetical protein
MLFAVFGMMSNVVASLLPGERHRRYVQVSATANLEGMEKLRRMVEEGKLKIPIDSCWDMEDALKVRLSAQLFSPELHVLI